MNSIFFVRCSRWLNFCSTVPSSIERIFEGVVS
jgi:hypothetical protein